MSLKRKTREHKMEVYSKMLSTVTPIAGNSRLGMTVEQGINLTEKTLAKRKAKRRSAKAARKRNRGK